MKSTSDSGAPTPFHVAIIMDGNGRWAAARGLARVEGHRRGVAAVRRVVEAAPALGIRTLTLYAFSADNWKRPGPEVGRLMGLFLAYLRREAPRLREEGVRLSVIGRRDRLPGALPSAIAAAEALTAGGRRLELRIAIDYSARVAILRAAAGLGTPSPRDGRSSSGGSPRRVGVRPTWISSSAPAASSASATSSCGKARTPSCTSRRGCGPTSAPSTSRRPSGPSGPVSAASAASPHPRRRSSSGRWRDEPPARAVGGRARLRHARHMASLRGLHRPQLVARLAPVRARARPVPAPGRERPHASGRRPARRRGRRGRGSGGDRQLRLPGGRGARRPAPPRGRPPPLPRPGAPLPHPHSARGGAAQPRRGGSAVRGSCSRRSPPSGTGRPSGAASSRAAS